MISYPEVLEELRLLGIKPRGGDYYDFRDFPLEQEFSRFFDFCQEYLDRSDLGYDVRPSRLFYNTMTTANGCAYHVGKTGLVEIWKGSVFWLYDYFLPRDDRFEDAQFQQYRTVVDRLQINPAYYLLQMSTLFFLYHETGHLIQQGGDIQEITEYMAKQCLGDAIRIRHSRELDADWFACHCLAMHVVMFAEKQAGQNKVVDPQLLEDAAALALAAVYVFFVRLSDGQPTIYFREKCHPHPLVRLSYSMVFLLDNLAGNTTILLDQRRVLTQAIRISEHIMKDPASNIVEEYTKVLHTHLDSIQAYIQEIIGDTKHYPQLCINRLRNKP